MRQAGGKLVLHSYSPIVSNVLRVLKLERVLDLTDAGIRRSLGVTLEELASEDWRKLLNAGRESFGQALGRAVADGGEWRHAG